MTCKSGLCACLLWNNYFAEVCPNCPSYLHVYEHIVIKVLLLFRSHTKSLGLSLNVCTLACLINNSK